MKLLTIMAFAIAAGLAAFGVGMAKTNPSQDQYEEYAVQRLSQYLKGDVCKKTSKLIENIINTSCDKIVDSANPQMQQLLSQTTERQDFFFFSVYRTDLRLNSWLPGYKFETVGAFDNFYTYTAEEQ
jgi:Domain of unknown function (DUF4359)